MGTVCVEIAVRDDPRLGDAIASLAAQKRRPDRVVLAADPTTPDTLVAAARARAPGLAVSVERCAGGVVAARARATAGIPEDVTAFLDSDETAPPEWLRRLLDPIERGAADFTGGPTRPSRPPSSALERYAVLLEASIYEGIVPAHLAYLPLQNSAFRSDLVRRLGFDARIPYAEDHDLESRALASGARGAFVPEAWVYHDPRTAPGYARWARKRYRYQVAMTMSLAKNGRLAARARERRPVVRHPLVVVDTLLKPFAFVDGTLRWRRVSAGNHAAA
jgi:glycosyltransferase involved in cell wall biosynthesis